MIIAIAGDSNQSIGSGKDTVGRIIQYLFWKKRVETENLSFHYTLTDFLKPNFCADKLANWEVKKFAEAPKNIVCLLTGCKRADLENEDFKNQELGEEWWYYKCVDGFSWCSITDKTTKKAVKHLPSWEIASYLDYKDCDVSDSIELIKPTYRTFLQRLGTEVGRDIVHPNIWCTSLMKDYSNGKVETTDTHYILKHEDSWIITDLRFPNEYKAVKDRKGLCIKVTRTYENACKNIPDIYAHSSETALNNHEFDYIIENNGTIGDLVVKVEEFLIKFNLLD